MSKINNGGQAFPYGDYTHGGEDGMTLRDWFAGQAMQQGMAVLISHRNNLNEHQLKALAETAYRAADAMLEAREAQP